MFEHRTYKWIASESEDPRFNGLSGYVNAEHVFQAHDKACEELDWIARIRFGLEKAPRTVIETEKLPRNS